MAITTSNDGGDPQGPVGVARPTPATRNRDGEDQIALGEATIRINPEVMRGVSPLPGLDEIEVVVVQPARTWARLTEELTVHVVGSGIVAAIAFAVGLMVAGPAIKAETTIKTETAQPASSCVVAPVPDIKDRNG